MSEILRVLGFEQKRFPGLSAKSVRGWLPEVRFGQERTVAQERCPLVVGNADRDPRDGSIGAGLLLAAEDHGPGD